MLSRRVKKPKGRCRLGYVRYRRVSTTRDNRAHAGKWKRSRDANGTLGKRMGNQRMCGATRRGMKEMPVAVDGDGLAVAAVGGVGARVRQATTLQWTKTPGLR